MTEINAEHWIAMINRISSKIMENRDNLNELDSAMGDGDHGTGISTAFSAAKDELEKLSDADVMTVLKETANALMNRMGGASGALYGTFFLKAALKAKGKSALSKVDIEQAFQAGLEAVKQRGKSDVGDKTMIDALSPAVDAFSTADNLSDAWENAAKSARNGAENTKNMIAKHGRAKFAGERSRGHIDAGASSIALMFEAIHDYWKEQK